MSTLYDTLRCTKTCRTVQGSRKAYLVIFIGVSNAIQMYAAFPKDTPMSLQYSIVLHCPGCFLTRSKSTNSSQHTVLFLRLSR